MISVGWFCLAVFAAVVLGVFMGSAERFGSEQAGDTVWVVIRTAYDEEKNTSSCELIGTYLRKRAAYHAQKKEKALKIEGEVAEVYIIETVLEE